jgi:hypothetical protein
MTTHDTNTHHPLSIDRLQRRIDDVDRKPVPTPEKSLMTEETKTEDAKDLADGAAKTSRIDVVAARAFLLEIEGQSQIDCSVAFERLLAMTGSLLNRAEALEKCVNFIACAWCNHIAPRGPTDDPMVHIRAHLKGCPVRRAREDGAEVEGTKPVDVESLRAAYDLAKATGFVHEATASLLNHLPVVFDRLAALEKYAGQIVCSWCGETSPKAGDTSGAMLDHMLVCTKRTDILSTMIQDLANEMRRARRVMLAGAELADVLAQQDVTSPMVWTPTIVKACEELAQAMDDWATRKERTLSPEDFRFELRDVWGRACEAFEGKAPPGLAVDFSNWSGATKDLLMGLGMHWGGDDKGYVFEDLKTEKAT